MILSVQRVKPKGKVYRNIASKRRSSLRCEKNDKRRNQEETTEKRKKERSKEKWKNNHEREQGAKAVETRFPTPGFTRVVEFSMGYCRWGWHLTIYPPRDHRSAYVQSLTGAFRYSLGCVQSQGDGSFTLRNLRSSSSFFPPFLSFLLSTLRWYASCLVDALSRSFVRVFPAARNFQLAVIFGRIDILKSWVSPGRFKKKI